jgi:perosamine synthetase
MSMDSSARHGAGRVAFESYLELGFNYRMTDIQAAIGREQLKRLPGIVAHRRELGDRYRKSFADLPGVIAPSEPPWARSNWQSYCVRLPEGCDQRGVMQELLDAGVATRRGIMCSHREPAYTSQEPWSCGAGPGNCDCPPGSCSRLLKSEKAQDRCILLPLYHQMTEEDQDRVIRALKTACKC